MMPGHNLSSQPSNQYGVGPSFVIVPVATVALATFFGLLGAKDHWIYWVVAAGSIVFVIWAWLRWPAPVPGSLGKSARITLLAGLALFAVGQFFLGLAAAGAEGDSSQQTLTGLNNTGSMFAMFGALLGLPGFILTLSLLIAARFGWNQGWQLGALTAGVGVAVVVLIAVIVSAF